MIAQLKNHCFAVLILCLSIYLALALLSVA